ncbi:cupredoxin domain-containing protein [Candidatus Woesearchaeota archaeon]|nr:cupredoxin domain-containing protein [Candidatus Woesearchaeota archaeon]
MKNTTIIALIGILVIGGALFLFTGNDSSQTNTVVGTGDLQKITLSEKNYNYYPQVLKVKAGQPVELTLDSSVSGCYRSFAIKELGVVQYARTPKDTIQFTLPKPGNYKFSCTMGMGTGTLVAE